MEDVDKILAGKYPARAHAAKVAAYLKSKHPNANGIIYLEGQKTRMIEDNDEPQPFRQRRYFYYLSGCPLPDCYLTYNLSTSTLTLFIPPIDPDSVIWSGLPLSPTEALALYDVDAVLPTPDVNASLSSQSSSTSTSSPPPSTIWAIQNQVSDHITFLAYDTTNFTALKPAIDECRVIKDAYEIALTRTANAISTLAHTAVLRAVRHARNERKLEAVFLQTCIANGCREQAYHSIVASGTNAATLHYQKNCERLQGRANVLLDAGGEFRCYAADVTRTFPIHGKFGERSRKLYDVVLRMQEVCLGLLMAGVVWDEVHAAAHRVAIEGLLDLGILRGDKEEIFKSRTSVAFFPHGLGHYLGMDTHDTGGHPDYEDADPMFKYLRVRGTLPAGSIITVEPGIYFCRFIIEPYLQDPVHSKFIDKDVLDRYWDVGGIRIEGNTSPLLLSYNILITETGYENLTTAVKDVDEMERIISSS